MYPDEIPDLIDFYIANIPPGVEGIEELSSKQTSELMTLRTIVTRSVEAFSQTHEFGVMAVKNWMNKSEVR